MQSVRRFVTQEKMYSFISGDQRELDVLSTWGNRSVWYGNSPDRGGGNPSPTRGFINLLLSHWSNALGKEAQIVGVLSPDANSAIYFEKFRGSSGY